MTFNQGFKVKITERKQLTSGTPYHELRLSGVVSCEVRSPKTSQPITFEWRFRVTCKRTPNGLVLLDMPERDDQGPFGGFISALIWDFLRDLA